MILYVPPKQTPSVSRHLYSQKYTGAVRWHLRHYLLNQSNTESILDVYRMRVLSNLSKSNIWEDSSNHRMSLMPKRNRLEANVLNGWDSILKKKKLMNPYVLGSLSVSSPPWCYLRNTPSFLPPISQYKTGHSFSNPWFHWLNQILKIPVVGTKEIC